MKRPIRILLICLICSLFISGVHAQDIPLPRLIDNADLLTPSEEDALTSVLDEISERQGADIVADAYPFCVIYSDEAAEGQIKCLNERPDKAHAERCQSGQDEHGEPFFNSVFH